ncbi:hypothetical protein [Brenneria izbisi]|uniref:Uncharacterized protein n=1 Tax=Brenneria izbisi TaxID=2939450 RepID=A0AA41XX21_9GAMM|nr:hypothetical protein [Brenneria izbisi]MCV9878141.1 hypothetical protein [Brenneria izbisi]MCV9881295.1 hypothetical protein [Brenneria izbisi]
MAASKHIPCHVTQSVRGAAGDKGLSEKALLKRQGDAEGFDSGIDTFDEVTVCLFLFKAAWIIKKDNMLCKLPKAKCKEGHD